MEKRAIDVAKALVRLSEVTIFELRGEFLRNAFTLSKRWLAAPPVEMKSLVLDIVERVTIAANRIDIWLNPRECRGFSHTGK
jgi:hypothetical protein